MLTSASVAAWRLYEEVRAALESCLSAFCRDEQV